MAESRPSRGQGLWGRWAGAGAALALPAHLRADPAFVAAARHSRRVAWLRRYLPLLCAGAIGFLVLRALGSHFLSAGPVDSAALRIEGRKVVMEKPRLSGFKRDGGSYEMTATEALQDLKAPNMVEMKTMEARIQSGAEGWSRLTGDRGYYDSKAERLDLKGNVRIRTDSGIEAVLTDAQVDFRPGTVATDNRSEVTTRQGNVESEKLRVLDGGKRLVFEGGVRSVFHNPEAASAEQPAGKAP